MYPRQLRDVKPVATPLQRALYAQRLVIRGLLDETSDVEPCTPVLRAAAEWRRLTAQGSHETV